MSSDPTEAIRRRMVASQGQEERAALAAVWGAVYATAEVTDAFTIEAFMAPFVVATRKADGVRGTLQFQHAPRFFFGFEPA
jgi:hypothetical protein